MSTQVLLNAVVRRVLLIDFDDYDEDLGRSSTLEVMTDVAVSDSNSDDTARIIQQSARTVAKADWRRLAVVIDRFFFIVFAVVMILTCLSFIGYL